jgi:hypothetical protein
VDDASWAALTLSLTVLGGIWTWFSFRRRGLASGLRALAFTLLPLAAYLTRTLRMFTRIGGAVADWATSLVFNPMVWSGVVVAGISVVLFVVSGMLRARQVGRSPAGAGRASKRRRGQARGAGRPDALPGGAGGGAGGGADDDMAEIEALLRKRGIS